MQRLALYRQPILFLLLLLLCQAPASVTLLADDSVAVKPGLVLSYWLAIEVGASPKADHGLQQVGLGQLKRVTTKGSGETG